MRTTAASATAAARPGLAAALIVVGGAVLCACPRPVATAQRTAGQQAGAQGRPSLLPADALLVARLSPAPRLQAAVGAVLASADRPGGLLEGSRARLRDSLGVDPLSKLTLALSGLDDDAPLTVAVRPRGELVVVVPVSGARRYDEALELIFGPDEATAARRGAVSIWRDRRGVVRALERRVGDRSVLALAPDDEVAAAALLATIDAPDFSLDDDEAFPVGLDEPAGTSAGEVVTAWTTPAARGRLKELAWFPIGDGPWILRGAMRGDTLHLSARTPWKDAPGAASTVARPPGSCALSGAALAWVELPATWLPDELADGRTRLTGQVALGVLPFREPLDAPPDDPLGAGHLVVLGAPASPDARSDLVTSFVKAVDGISAQQRSLGDRELFTLPGPQGAPWRQLSALVGPEMFMLVSGPFPPGSGDEQALLAALGRPCAPSGARARLSLDGERLRARLPGEDLAPASSSGASAALLRLLARGLVGVSRADVEVRSLPGVLLLDATIGLKR